jgi:hypothetical protein
VRVRACLAAIALTLSLSACGSGSNSGAELATNIRESLGAKSVQKIECKEAGLNGKGEKARSCEVAYTTESENIEKTGTETLPCNETLEVGPNNKPIVAPGGAHTCTPTETRT